jgi:threonine aldolase
MAGTQTNLTALSAFLRPHHAIIAADTAHICVHETGSIEATGHKIYHVPNVDGKILPEQIVEVVELHTDEHMVKPKLVYISNTTEIGTVYSKEEIERLRVICDRYGLYLFCDGARMGCALTCEDAGLTLADMAKLTDAFYIGGTKNGAMMGEALVISNPALQEDFRYIIKQRGGMLAKGRLLGVQFLELLKDGLYFELADHANKMAHKVQAGMVAKGYEFSGNSPTNQIFRILKNEQVAELAEKVSFEVWGKHDDEHTIIRFVTSWGTTEAEVEELLNIL